MRTLASFVRLSSVSAHASRRPEVDTCATWLARHLAAIGLEHARVVPTPTGGPPVVVMAEGRRPAGASTVLLYGHYDVQPAEQSEWTDPPFTAEVSW